MQTKAFTNPTPAKYRNRVEIVAQILKAVNVTGGTTKAKIMYGAFLTYDQLQCYLKLLIEGDLLRPNASNTFTITEKGIDFLKTYR
jgi:predicted transcriptional regulator